VIDVGYADRLIRYSLCRTEWTSQNLCESDHRDLFHGGWIDHFDMEGMSLFAWAVPKLLFGRSTRAFSAHLSAR
jgi:hypothetical protein